MYEKYSPYESARLVHHYITNMVDKEYDNLPYWLLLPNKKPAEAAHCRVDDAELVGSWYEGLVCAMRILDTDDGADVKASLRRHLMKSWGEHGLRFCEPYPWTHTVHASFHEMGYILPAINLITEEYPDDAVAEKRASELVRGMRSLVIERKIRCFWSGDSPETVPIYEFPNDIYLKDGGFDLTRHTGRGEQAIRNGVVLPALVRRYELKGDEAALDLAVGIANHVLGPSRYFSYKMEFFGHVHSAVWFASGLVKLGRLIGNEEYIKKGKGIYDFVRSMSSSFGWVPEYARWHEPKEEHCETCCIKDMIVCAHELIECGYDEYWDDMNKFARNQLVENQVTYTGYVVCDNTKPDDDGITYRDIDKRMVGGFTGGSEPNSISLTRFRSIAGCCVGTAPVALKTVWDDAVTEENGAYIVNIPFDKETDALSMRSFIPDEGKIVLTAKKDCRAGFRLYGWIVSPRFSVNGASVSPASDGKTAVFDLEAGDELTLAFDLADEERKETVREEEYTAVWRGPDVVDLLPRGDHVRLYQRNSEIPKFLPGPDDVEYTGAANYGPTQQSKTK
ncbi:MAG: glycoside hydrolase family 127 protein [Clostridia bacterium]|nr:glycoside hydrolase family 127 protein [Clostridia bacterium]